MPSAQKFLGAILIVGVWAALIAVLPPHFPSLVLVLFLEIIVSVVFLAIGLLYWGLPESEKEDGSAGQAPLNLSAAGVNQLTSVDSQRWLKERFPRIWDFVNAYSIITNESDYQLATSRLKVLFGWHGMQGGDMRSDEEAMDAVYAEEIAMAILLGKKQFAPQRKRFWE